MNYETLFTELVCLALFIAGAVAIARSNWMVIPWAAMIVAILVGHNAPEFLIGLGRLDPSFMDGTAWFWIDKICYWLVWAGALFMLADIVAGMSTHFTVSNNGIPTYGAGGAVQQDVIIKGVIGLILFAGWGIYNTVGYFGGNPKFEQVAQLTLEHDGIRAQVEPFILEMDVETELDPTSKTEWEKKLTEIAETHGFKGGDFEIFQLKHIRWISSDGRRITHAVIVFDGKRKRDGAPAVTERKEDKAKGVTAFPAIPADFEPLEGKSVVIPIAPTRGYTDGLLTDLQTRYMKITVTPGRVKPPSTTYSSSSSGTSTIPDFRSDFVR